MTKLTIDYRTIYQYARPVTLSPHIMRIFPRGELHSEIRSFEFTTNEDANTRFRHDVFDNLVAHCYYPDNPQRELRAFFTAELELRESNPFEFLLDSEALEIPFTYSDRHRAVLEPALRLDPSDQALNLPPWVVPQRTGPTIDVLSEMARSICSSAEYERRDIGDPRRASETIRLKAGACRDLAILFHVAARQLGLASRLVSGYLAEFQTPLEARRAEGSFHAWNEVFLPGAGWIGIDPTNGVLASHSHIACAVGLTPEDIAPVSGSFFGAANVPSTMHMRLQLIPSEWKS